MNQRVRVKGTVWSSKGQGIRDGKDARKRGKGERRGGPKGNEDKGKRVRALSEAYRFSTCVRAMRATMAFEVHSALSVVEKRYIKSSTRIPKRMG